MTPSEPDADMWLRLFASLSGDPTVDAEVVRAFCQTHSARPG